VLALEEVEVPATSSGLRRSGLYALGAVLVVGGVGIGLFLLYMAVFVGAVMDGPTGMPATDPALGVGLAIVGLGFGGLLLWGGISLIRSANA
jgi:hypothetical protein